MPKFIKKLLLYSVRTWVFLSEASKSCTTEIVIFLNKAWKRLISTLKRRWNSLCQGCKEGKYIFLAVFVAGLLLLPCLLADETSQSIRWWGTLLQAFGIAAVIYGLEKTSKLFGMSGFLGSFISILRHFRNVIWPTKQNHLIIAGTGHIKLSGSAVTAHGIVSFPEDSSIELRIEFLEKIQLELQARMSELDKKLAEQDSSLREEIKSTASELREADQDTHNKLEEAIVGGIHIEAVGVVYIFFGMIFVSIPKEFAAIIKLI